MAFAACAACCADCCAEFKCKYLRFGNDTTHGEVEDWRQTFGRNMFFGRESLAVTLAVRGFGAVLMFVIWVWAQMEHVTRGDGSDADTEPDTFAYGYFWIYLTNITLTLQVLYHIVMVVVALQAREGDDGCCSVLNVRSPSKVIPPLAKLAWFLQAAVLPMTFFVFVLYWALVFDGTVRTLSVLTHGVNFAVMMIDSFASGFPLLLAHLLYFFAFMIIYLLWSWVHHSAGLTNEHGDAYIYSSLDWAYPDYVQKLAVAIILVAAPIVTLGCWSIMRWRGKAFGLQGIAKGKSWKSTTRSAGSDAARSRRRQQDEAEEQGEEEGTPPAKTPAP
jgi:hypothetical protein